MEITSSFPERLQEALGGTSLTSLAVSIGISKQSVSAYLNGKRKPKRFVIEAIARELNVNPAWLCGYDAPRYLPASAEPTHTEAAFDPLAPDEKKLVDDYRRLSPAGKEYILQTMAMALRSYEGKNNAASDLEKAN